MSDRIAVMNKGRVEQAASPRAIYEEPDDGVRRRLPGRVEPARGRGGRARRRGLHGPRSATARFALQPGRVDARGEVKVMIRPERIGIEPHAEHRRASGCRGSSSARSSSAARTRCTSACSAASCSRRWSPTTAATPPVSLEPGAAVSVHLPPDAAARAAAERGGDRGGPGRGGDAASSATPASSCRARRPSVRWHPERALVLR